MALPEWISSDYPSKASSGYKVTLNQLKIHSRRIQGDTLVVDGYGDLSIK